MEAGRPKKKEFPSWNWKKRTL